MPRILNRTPSSLGRRRRSHASYALTPSLKGMRKRDDTQFFSATSLGGGSPIMKHQLCENTSPDKHTSFYATPQSSPGTPPPSRVESLVSSRASSVTNFLSITPTMSNQAMHNRKSFQKQSSLPLENVGKGLWMVSESSSISLRPSDEWGLFVDVEEEYADIERKSRRLSSTISIC